MTKTTGLGAGLLVAGRDLSGDTQQVDRVAGSFSPLVMTGIDKEAFERDKGQIDGEISMTTFFNPDSAAAHPTLKGLPTTDRVVTYCHRKTEVGDRAASILAKQIGYDPTRGQDGSLVFGVQALANGFGLEWGHLLTPGVRADGATPTNGASLDYGAAVATTLFGLQAYLHVTAIASGSATITIEDSTDDSIWASVAVFSAVTAQGSERIQTARDTQVDRFLRVTSTGTFTGLSFLVMVKKNLRETLF